MSLSIGVGIYHGYGSKENAESSLQKINTALKEDGLPEHVEPREVNDDNRSELLGLSYSFLHYLRRFYAHCLVNPEKTPEPVRHGNFPSNDPIFENDAWYNSHLICHSDSDGFYVPIKFDQLVPIEDELGVSALGSSYTLFNELVQIAPKLGIKLDNEELSDREVKKIIQRSHSEETFWIELEAWLVLYEAARISIREKALICFS